MWQILNKFHMYLEVIEYTISIIIRDLFDKNVIHDIQDASLIVMWETKNEILSPIYKEIGNKTINWNYQYVNPDLFVVVA